MPLIGLPSNVTYELKVWQWRGMFTLGIWKKYNFHNHWNYCLMEYLLHWLPTRKYTLKLYQWNSNLVWVDPQIREGSNLYRNSSENVQRVVTKCTNWKKFATLQDIVTERMLGGKNSVQVPFLLKLLFVGLKTMFPSPCTL